jgi:hypothetical protein
MMTRGISLVLLLCLVACVFLMFSSDEAVAQDYMEKKGIEGVFQGKGLDEEKQAKQWQKILGIVALPVAIAVMKWL